MSWSNYHSHTHYCDGTDPAETYLKEAVRRGFRAWGVSSHAPVPFPCKWTMEESRLPEYINEILDLKLAWTSQLQVYLGLEVDFIPGLSGPAKLREQAPQLDYCIGSVHFVDQMPDGRPWEIDGRHEVFLEGLAAIFGNSLPHAIGRYFELIRQMVEQDPPDVVGHLDKIIIQHEKGDLFSGNEDWYQQAALQTLECIRDRGLIVEVNTRGIYKGIIRDPYPASWLLKQMHEMGIAITLNSDAHHPREIAGAFPETAQLLREIGFSRLHILYDQEWQPVPFDRWGIRVDDPSLLLGV